MANVTGGRDWRESDEKYVRTRILRAIRSIADDPAIGNEVPGFLKRQ
jgi:hypothetical protein